MVLASCESGETHYKQAEARPGDTIVINNTTKVYLDLLENAAQSGMGAGFGWLNGEGVFITTTPDPNAADPASMVETTTKVGGISRSDGWVEIPVIDCGENFIDVVFTPAGDPSTEDISNTDSIGSKTVQVLTGSDGQKLYLNDLWRYILVGVTEAVPHVEPSSSVTGVRYEAGTTADTRIVWVKVEVQHTGVEGTRRTSAMTQSYEVGYVQTKAGAVEPEDPFEVRLHNFDLFRTYRKKTQHSICEGFMSFAVYNARTGELVEEISTDGFSSQLAKCGHFGAPTNGYIIREASVLGNAPTEVTENVVADNEEALSASYVNGNFKLTVKCTSQDYYVHFPVRGRDDSEGGIAAGGQNLFFTATCVYTNPETGWTKTWEFTHRTEVKVKGWEQRTPQVDRSKETVNDVDGTRNLRYAGTYVVEFVNHLYLNGEEVVQEDGNDDYYFQTSKTNGSTVPFHTSEMAIDTWVSYLP